jgi:hypothetical protein
VWAARAGERWPASSVARHRPTPLACSFCRPPSPHPHSEFHVGRDWEHPTCDSRTCTRSWAYARIAYPAVELLRRVRVVSRIVIAIVSVVVHGTGAPRGHKRPPAVPQSGTKTWGVVARRAWHDHKRVSAQRHRWDVVLCRARGTPQRSHQLWYALARAAGASGRRTSGSSAAHR